jgi:hypothetical protein
MHKWLCCVEKFSQVGIMRIVDLHNSFHTFSRLQCEASGIKPSNWSTCPVMQCEGGLLSIDNSTTSGCNITTCAYAGFNKNQSIFTTLATRSTCPVTAGNYSQ